MWIIRRYDTENDAEKDFKLYKNLPIESYEKYMLIERKLNDILNNRIYIDDELEYKQFKKFTITNNDTLINYIEKLNSSIKEY